MFILIAKYLSNIQMKLVFFFCISFQSITKFWWSLLFCACLLPEMQIEGRTFDVWCAMCSKTSLAKVSLPSVALSVASILILLHDLTSL